jgi:hypothetical protein
VSKAVARLRLAPSSRCPACGRITKTVDGVCADCWAPKEPNARTFRRKPRTEPLFDFDWDDPRIARAAVGVAVLIAAGVLRAFW